MRILIKALLRKSHMHFTTHPFQIEVLIAHSCILIKHFVEFAKLEQDDLIGVLALDAPILLHGFGEGLDGFRRDEQSRRVVLGMIGTTTFVISAALGSGPFRGHICELFSGHLLA
jgi:hypothetical protein